MSSLATTCNLFDQRLFPDAEHSEGAELVIQYRHGY